MLAAESSHEKSRTIPELPHVTRAASVSVKGTGIMNTPPTRITRRLVKHKPQCAISAKGFLGSISTTVSPNCRHAARAEGASEAHKAHVSHYGSKRARHQRDIRACHDAVRQRFVITDVGNRDTFFLVYRCRITKPDLEVASPEPRTTNCPRATDPRQYAATEIHAFCEVRRLTTAKSGPGAEGDNLNSVARPVADMFSVEILSSR